MAFVARREYEREDLLREATALVERAELEVAGCDDPVLIGFRKGGEASLLLGQSRAFHFNAAGELRRAYVDGVLYKAERGRLVALRRQRTDTEVELMRSDLSDDEGRELVARLRTDVSRLHDALQGGHYRVLGQVPEQGNAVQRTQRWLSALPPRIAIAQRPHVR